MSSTYHHQYTKHSDSSKASYTRSAKNQQHQQYSYAANQGNHSAAQNNGSGGYAKPSSGGTFRGGAAAGKASGGYKDREYDNTYNNNNNYQSKAGYQEEAYHETGRYHPNREVTNKGSKQSYAGPTSSSSNNQQRRYQDGRGSYTAGNSAAHYNYNQTDDYYQEEYYYEEPTEMPSVYDDSNSRSAYSAPKNAYRKDKKVETQAYSTRSGKQGKHSQNHQAYSIAHSDTQNYNDYYNYGDEEETPTSRSSKDHTYYGTNKKSSSYPSHTYSSRGAAQSQSNNSSSYSHQFHQNYKGQERDNDNDYNNQDSYYGRGDDTSKKTSKKFEREVSYNNQVNPKRGKQQDRFYPAGEEENGQDGQYYDESYNYKKSSQHGQLNEAYSAKKSGYKQQQHRYSQYQAEEANYYDEEKTNYSNSYKQTSSQLYKSSQKRSTTYQGYSTGAKGLANAKSSNQNYHNHNGQYQVPEENFDQEEEYNPEEIEEHHQHVDNSSSYNKGYYTSKQARQNEPVTTTRRTNNHETDSQWDKKWQNEEGANFNKGNDHYLHQQEEESTPGSRYRPKKQPSNNSEEEKMTAEKIIITVQTGQGGSKKDEYDMQNNSESQVTHHPQSHRKVTVIRQEKTSYVQDDERERRESSSSWVSIEDGSTIEQQQPSISGGSSNQNHPLNTSIQDLQSVASTTSNIQNQRQGPPQNPQRQMPQYIPKQDTSMKTPLTKLNNEEPSIQVKKDTNSLNQTVSAPPVTQQPQLKSMSSGQSQHNESPTLRHQLSKNSHQPIPIEDELEHIFKIPEPEYKLLDTNTQNNHNLPNHNIQAQPAVPVLGAYPNPTQHIIQNDDLQNSLSKQFSQQLILSQQQQQQNERRGMIMHKNNYLEGSGNGFNVVQSQENIMQQQMAWGCQQQQQEQSIRQQAMQNQRSQQEYSQMYNNNQGIQQQQMRSVSMTQSSYQPQTVQNTQQHYFDQLQEGGNQYVPMPQKSPTLLSGYLDERQAYNAVQYSPGQQHQQQKQMQFYNTQIQNNNNPILYDGFFQGSLDPESSFPQQRNQVNQEAHPSLHHSQSMGPTIGDFDPRLQRLEASPNHMQAPLQHLYQSPNTYYPQVQTQEFQPFLNSQPQSKMLNQNAQEYIPIKKKLQIVGMSKSESMHSMMPPQYNIDGYPMIESSNNLGAVSSMSQFDLSSNMGYDQNQQYQYQMMQSKNHQYPNHPMMGISQDYIPNGHSQSALIRNQSMGGDPGTSLYNSSQILLQHRPYGHLSNPYYNPNQQPFTADPSRALIDSFHDDNNPSLNNNNPYDTFYHDSADDVDQLLLHQTTLFAQSLVGHEPAEFQDLGDENDEQIYGRPSTDGGEIGTNLDPSQPPFQASKGGF